jgi:hypothetical protein
MHPRQAALLEQADSLTEKLAAGAPVLWKYVDPDGGGEFFLAKRMQNVHSPFSGRSIPQKPERFQPSEVGKELKEQAKEQKAAPGAPGPKSGAPKAAPKKKKHAADDPAWKVG